MATSVLSVADLQKLLDALSDRGYEIVGPTIRNGAVAYQRMTSTAELPIGCEESQAGGHYRLRSTATKSLFSFVPGPESLKRFLFPPNNRLFQAHRQKASFAIEVPDDNPIPIVFLGPRACEMSALAILDKILLEGPYQSGPYRQRRQEALIIAVNCTRAGDTCFCASMNTGPRVKGGYDILLTEIAENGDPICLADPGTDRGEELLTELELPDASEEQLALADAAIARTESAMGRTMNTDQLPDILWRSLDDREWEEVASRCLNCGNCTMVCPTCFCTTTEDSTDLSGDTAVRVLRWDSCHNLDFSYIHGGSIRVSAMSRYRQWMMHKLAYWPEQFDAFGCVGCGRCITWCPVGIDITEQAASIRESVSR